MPNLTEIPPLCDSYFISHFLIPSGRSDKRVTLILGRMRESDLVLERDEEIERESSVLDVSLRFN